jgi:peptidoglycan/LPS O-acetylase OafA/YrhL
LAITLDRQRSDAVAESRPRTEFRADIEGLRAVAILLVVGYHAGFGFLHGGFIGVDIFFVLSGYLITRLLLVEVNGSGGISFARFYARRARRLPPAVSVMLVGVVVATFIVKSPLEWRSAATEVWATIFYVSNQFFANHATDYFGAGIHVSPLLHTWTLAVEEQFYIIWPITLLAIVKLTLGPNAARKRTYAIATLTVVSLFFSLRLTNALSPGAFFGLPSRAWEFGAGALLACTIPFWERLHARARNAIALAGCTILTVALITIGPTTLYPGRAALLPVSAAVALIAAGIGGTTVVGGLLARGPMRAVGRVSYSWYLWHWPVLIFGEQVLNRSTLGVRVGLIALSLVPTIISYRLIENPVRTNPTLARSGWATIRIVGAFVLVAIVAATVLTTVGAAEDRDPYIATLQRARADRPPLDTTCATTHLDVLLRSCSWGDITSNRTVLVIGDSHAAQWLPAIDGAARDLRLRVIASVQGNCPDIGTGATQELPSCGTRLKTLPNLIRQLHPALVVSSNSSNYVGALVDGAGHHIAKSQQVPTWGNEMYDLATTLRDQHIPFLDLLDNPKYNRDPLDCLADRRNASRCEIARAAGVASVATMHTAELDALARAHHGASFDPTGILCGATTCPLFSNGMVTYNDQTHLTKSYAATLGPVIEPVLRSALSS